MNMSYLVLGLGFAWAIQYVLSFYQLRRFYNRIYQLRRQHQGIAAIGMAGSAWRRRQYAVLVVDENDRILAAEQLSGWTIFANLKPVKGLVGLPSEALFDDQAVLSISKKKKLLLAFRNAAEHLNDAKQDASDSKEPQEEGAVAEAQTTA